MKGKEYYSIGFTTDDGTKNYTNYTCRLCGVATKEYTIWGGGVRCSSEAYGNTGIFNRYLPACSIHKTSEGFKEWAWNNIGRTISWYHPGIGTVSYPTLKGEVVLCPQCNQTGTVWSVNKETPYCKHGAYHYQEHCMHGQTSLHD